MKNTLFILALISMAIQSCDNGSNEKTVITVHNSEISKVDNRLFGQFLEKPSWHGEWGPEAALKPGTNELQEGVVELMEEMHIPVLRFPGGTDVNEQDWTTMIDNAPEREGDRPEYVGIEGDTVTNMFGYDEACRLAEEIDAEMMLVINFGDAYFKRKSIEEAAMHEAGLIAYCNAALDAALPEGMPNWPEIRAMNGHPEPYNVKYVQIANEPWVMDNKLKRRGEIDPELKEHYFEILEAFIEAFLEIDPDIKIIADGNSEDITIPLRERFGSKIDYLSYHIYKPWGINEIKRGETVIPRDSLTEEEIWKTWIAVPEFNAEGESVIDNDIYNMLRNTGYPIAVTEWNWNGWWGNNSVDQEQLGSHFTKGIGAAGFLHALMREGSIIDIATQSMLVGRSWGITGIRVSEEEAFDPYPLPTGQVTGFYSQHHGNALLKTESKNVAHYEQPYRMSGIGPVDSVKYLDILATKDDDKIYLHVINRHYDEDVETKINLTGFEAEPKKMLVHHMTGNIDNTPCEEGLQNTGCFSTVEVELSAGNTVKLPKRSVSIVEIMF